MNRIDQVRDWLKEYAGKVIDATAAHVTADADAVGSAVAGAEAIAHRIIEYVAGHGVPADEAAPVAEHVVDRLVTVEVPGRKGE